MPRRLARALGGAGHDAVHTLDLAKRNRTPDSDVRSLATRETRVVVTKDEDFVTSYLLKGSPPKLLLISTGNISNDVLLSLVTSNLPTIEAALLKHDFVELSRTAIIIHV